MAKTSSVFICQQCGYQSPTFLGKCPECNSWNSLVEQLTSSSSPSQKKLINTEIINTKDIDKEHFNRFSTGFSEFDRVLGGGIVQGSVTLVAGDPGIGKSTLLSQLALNINDLASNPVLYVAGEESARQIKLRVERIDPKKDLAVLNETDIDVISEVIKNVKPKLVIIDSIQTMETQDLSQAAGSVSQVRESAHRLQRLAKSIHIPIVIVGHVTKEGTVAGPRTLEHIVDVVLSLEGDPSTNFRILRSSKNRFGSTDEVGVFEMDEKGMTEVINPSKLFLEEKVNAPGSAVVAILTGLRPMLLEVQALVTKTNSPIPRRIGNGIDNNRLQLLAAVLAKRLRLPLFDQDIFVNVTGGIRITEPAADLGICMAIISSFKDIAIDPKTVLIGEVGLLGEVRNVRNLEIRVKEAKKLGFSKVISPPTIKSLDQAIKTQNLQNIRK